MGGYAAYIWPSYGIAAAVLALLLMVSVSGTKARERELRALEEHAGPRRRRRSGVAAGEGTQNDA